MFKRALFFVLAVALSQPVWAATFTVNSTADAVDAAPGNGVCAAASGACTLRAAFMEANALAGDDTIVLPAGTYILTIANPPMSGGSEFAGLAGDLDVNQALSLGNLTLTGAGAATTIIDGNGLDRVIDIYGNSSAAQLQVSIANVTVRGGGGAINGGGIYIWSGTSGLPPAVTIADSVITGNSANSGAGIYNGSGVVQIRRTSIVANVSGCSGAGILNNDDLTLDNVTISGNTSQDCDGGGLDASDSTLVRNSTIAFNTPDNVEGFSDTLVFRNTLIVTTGSVNCVIDPDFGSASFDVIALDFDEGGNFAAGAACGAIPATANAGLIESLSTASNGQRVHRPRAGNPAINGGNNAQCLSDDQRGLTRAGQGNCDSGSVELRAPAITNTPPGATVNVPYAHTYTATGETPLAFAVTAGSLPTGVLMSSAGVFTGTPTAVGVFPFTVTLTDSVGQTATQSTSITVSGGAPPPLQLQPAVLPTAVLFRPYEFRFQAQGVSPAFGVTGGALPAGMQLGRDGLLMGTPTQSGAFRFTVTVRDSFGQERREDYTLLVNGPPTISGLGDATVQENAVIPPVPITLGDDLTSVDALTATVSVSDPQLVSSASLTGTGAQRQLQLVLAAERRGVATIRITASDGTLSSTATATLTVVAPSPPQPPTGLRATPDGNAVLFSWNAPTSGAVPTFYVLEGGNASGAVTLPVINTASRATSYRTLVPNGKWYFRVRSGNSAGTSAPSNEILGNVGLPGSPGAPGALVVTVVNNLVTLTWQPPAGAPIDTWVLEFGTTPTATNLGVFLLPGTLFTIKGVVPPGEYYARVRGANAAGSGPASNEVRFVIGPVGCGGEAPNAPALLPAVVDNGLVTLTWRAPTNQVVSRYAILVGSAPGQSDLGVFDVGPVTSFAGRAPSGVYYVALVATNECGSSPPSNTIVVNVP